MAHLRVFGCLCFAKEPNQVRKLGDHSRPGVFIGYIDGAKAYRVYDPVSRRVLMSRDVIFDETRGWDWSGSAAHAALVVQELVFDDFDSNSPAPGETGSAASTGAVPTPRGGGPSRPLGPCQHRPLGQRRPPVSRRRPRPCRRPGSRRRPRLRRHPRPRRPLIPMLQ